VTITLSASYTKDKCAFYPSLLRTGYFKQNTHPNERYRYNLYLSNYEGELSSTKSDFSSLSSLSTELILTPKGLQNTQYTVL
jgi:hypothetical protein